MHGLVRAGPIAGQYAMLDPAPTAACRQGVACIDLSAQEHPVWTCWCAGPLRTRYAGERPSGADNGCRFSARLKTRPPAHRGCKRPHYNPTPGRRNMAPRRRLA